MKKVLLISVINLLAYVAIMALIYSEFGIAFSVKFFAPATIIFSTNLATMLTCIPKARDTKQAKAGGQETQKTGDGTLS